jgi:hypothetical protein
MVRFYPAASTCSAEAPMVGLCLAAPAVNGCVYERKQNPVNCHHAQRVCSFVLHHCLLDELPQLGPRLESCSW